MANLKRFFEIHDNYQEIAEFAIIYIEEAHPNDTWNFKTQVMVDSHRTIDDRIEAANKLHMLRPDIPMYIDTMDDKLNTAFGALPERLYIILDNVVVYQGGMGPFGYNLNSVQNWLNDHASYNKVDTLNNNA